LVSGFLAVNLNHAFFHFLEKFQGMGSTATIDGQAVSFQYLDGEKDKDRLPPCEVGGYPTFCFLHKGKAHRYQGPRSPEGYKDFVQKVLNGSA
jgi:hypothetical protein